MKIKCKHTNYDEMIGHVCVNGDSENCTEIIINNCMDCNDFEIDFDILSKDEMKKIKDDAFIGINNYKTEKEEVTD